MCSPYFDNDSNNANHNCKSKNIITLYHGSANKFIIPEYGKGKETNDYGKGFYLTDSYSLAGEWAASDPKYNTCFIYEYTLDCSDLKILDFGELDTLCWLAELMKHRPAADPESKRYTLYAPKFINKYSISTDGFDVIKGRRADASYFRIAEDFVRDEFDVETLENLSALSDFGIQYCIKSQKAYECLKEAASYALDIPKTAYYSELYKKRDITVLKRMNSILNSSDIYLGEVFTDLVRKANQ